MSRSKVRYQRGAIYVEALVTIPVLATLWMIVLFIERGNTVDDETVERSRYCAWRVAADRCASVPARCELDGPSHVDGAELDGASSGALLKLVGVLPFLGKELMDPHGQVFRVTTRDRLDRPFGWGAIDVASQQSRMCQTPKGIWRAPMVFAATCAWHDLTFCSITSIAMDLAGVPGWAIAGLGWLGFQGAVAGAAAGQAGLLGLDGETTMIPIDGTAGARLDAWRDAQR